MKHYEGQRTSQAVNVHVNACPLDPRLDLRNHSPTGFEWGYGGSGPAQLALAILADCLGDEAALRQYQEFKRSIIATLASDHWSLTEEEVLEALKDGRTNSRDA